MVTVADATIAAFEAVQTEVVIGRTGAVIETFNRLDAAGSNVAAAFHLTC